MTEKKKQNLMHSRPTSRSSRRVSLRRAPFT